MEVDGIGNSEVYCGLERHGLHEREGGVPELELRIEQALVRAVVGAELNADTATFSLWDGWESWATLSLYIDVQSVF